MNTVKTVLLMTLMMVLFLFIGSFIGGRQGMVIAFGFSLLMNFVSYWSSDKIVLAMYRAREVSREEQPELFSMVERLACNASLPTPKMYIIQNQTPNAFATGRNPEHSAVAVTTGILEILTGSELEGVLSHELTHVKNRDILTGSIVATMAGTITFLARMAGYAMIFSGRGRDDDRSDGLESLFLLILAPIAATLVQLAISRSREYAADEGGAKISEHPMELATALRKLSQANKMLPMRSATPASAHMFIVNPLSGRSMMSLFSTHPPMEERIRRLESMAGF